MTYPLKPRHSSRIATTNVEESAEVEVAVLTQNKATDRIICNVKIKNVCSDVFADVWQQSKRQCDCTH